MRALALLAALVGAWLLPVGPPGIGVPIVAAIVLAAAAAAHKPTPFQVTLGVLALALAAQSALLDAGWVVALDLSAAWVLAAVAVGGVRLRSLAAPLARLSRVPTVVPAPSLAYLPALRGVLIGTVVVLPFAGLFLAGDAAFAAFAEELPLPSIDLLPERALAFVIVLAAALGLALAASEPSEAQRAGNRGRLGVLEWLIPLALLDALFLAFVLVQLAVLFGGHDRVLETSGLTYAEYARSGFWQLLTACALTFAVFGAAATFARVGGTGQRLALRLLLGGLGVLTLVVLLSAFHRLRLYEEAFGLTRLRLAAEAATVWLGLLLVLVLTVRRRLAEAVAVAGGLALLAFSLASPDRMVAERNVDRWRQTGRIDTQYLSRLSADAVPAVLELPAALRSTATTSIARDLEDSEPWGSTNSSRRRARALLE
ncbi:MAG: DUF4173 domain-containing protein [Actinobacteria bacterium]|nr:DUF4173 domain-containing protein [Actinomycetota bacterium]